MIEIKEYNEVRKLVVFGIKKHLVVNGYKLTGKLKKDIQTYCGIKGIVYERRNMKSIIDKFVIEYASNNNIEIKNRLDKKVKRRTGAEWTDLRSKVFAEHKNECACCGSKEFLQVDHIYPVSVFPRLSLEYSNLQILCRSCNIKKGNRFVKKY